MATKKGKSRTAAANAARRKQGPTKGTDYKNGRAVTAAAKAKRNALSKTAAQEREGARARDLSKKADAIRKEMSMTKSDLGKARLRNELTKVTRSQRISQDIYEGKRTSSGQKATNVGKKSTIDRPSSTNPSESVKAKVKKKYETLQDKTYGMAPSPTFGSATSGHRKVKGHRYTRYSNATSKLGDWLRKNK